MLLLQNENEGDLVDSIILQHALIPGLNDLLGLINTDDFERMVEVRDRNLLDLKDVVAVEDGLKVLRGEELGLELIKAVVVRIGLTELLALDRLEHLEDGSLRILRLFVQDVCHQFLHTLIAIGKAFRMSHNFLNFRCAIVIMKTYVEELVDSVFLQVLVDTLDVIEVFGADADLLHLPHDLVHLFLSVVSCSLPTHASFCVYFQKLNYL